MKVLATLTFISLFHFAWGQNILFIDDNDYVFDNTDTVITTLQSTTYSSFDYYNAYDSTAMPDLQVLSYYDLVIYYASVDGGNLRIWDDGTSGSTPLVDYLVNGGKAWIIGQDILYGGQYSAPTSFTTGDFAYEYMGLDSYNVQSYVNDNNVGVSEVSTTPSAPSNFPSPLTWIFPTNWNVDGVTVRNGGLDFYEMGPATYTLYQEVTMTHFKDGQTDVLSTFFDPALISNFNDRKDFLESSIFYMLNYDLGINKTQQTEFKLYPNPSKDEVTIELKDISNGFYTLTSRDGAKLKTGELTQNSSTLSVSDLAAGIYFLTVNGSTQKIVKM